MRLLDGHLGEDIRWRWQGRVEGEPEVVEGDPEQRRERDARQVLAARDIEIAADEPECRENRYGQSHDPQVVAVPEADRVGAQQAHHRGAAGVSVRGGIVAAAGASSLVSSRNTDSSVGRRVVSSPG